MHIQWITERHYHGCSKLYRERNWDENFAAIKEIDYDGWLMIEAFGLALPELAAATCIWRRMFPSEEHLAQEGLKFMKSRMAS